MAKKIIGFDLDGVFLDFSELKRSRAAERGIFLSPQETPSDIFQKKIPKELYEELQNELYAKPPHALSIPLIQGAKEGLKRIHCAHIPFFLVSRRKSPEVAIQVLKKHELWPGYFNEKNSFFVNTPEEKDIQARKLSITHFVDDESKVLDCIQSVRHKILFDPLNIFSDDETYIRISSWDDLTPHLLN